MRNAELGQNLTAVRARIAEACTAAGRPVDAVTLIAVTKGWPASDAALLRDLGVGDLGENRDQEARDKAAAVPGVRWHFVGAVQTNKAKSVAGYADMVHSVDRPGLVETLAAGAARAGRHVEVLLQVSLDGDPDRGGALPADLWGLAERVANVQELQLRGVMAIAPQAGNPAASFGRLRELASELVAVHPEATLISAGMSGDLEAAIAAGATHVRVGTALLGHRPAALR